MSDFKFACPVCGQHITANSDATGSQLECPTCFRKIVVPQAPGSSDPKFILSAAEANKPKPQQPAPSETSVAPLAKTSFPVGLILGVLVVIAAGAAVFGLRDRIFKDDAPKEVENEIVTTNKLTWTLDLSEMEFPTNIASGRLQGRDFVCQRATLQNGNLTLRHGRSGLPDLGLTIAFYSDKPEDLAGKTIHVTTNNTGPPRVTLRWKEWDQAFTAMIADGYALNLEFGPITATGMQGRIYLCLPDAMKSCVAGVFNAEIRRPAPRPPRRRD